jgi:hypothetical protein
MPVMNDMITQNQRSPVGDTLSRSASPPTTPARTLLVPERQIRGLTPNCGESGNEVRRESIGVDDSTLFSGRSSVIQRGRSLEEIDYSTLQGILGPNNEQAVVLYQFFQDLRAVAQVIDRYANVGPNCFPDQCIGFVSKISGEKSLDGRSHAVDDRPQVMGLILRRRP